ncbi:uncharacterized protein LOC105665365 [Ceratitis capitata]|uniref:(Mediterranean fruit fly) hypothetical protein n=1 Tax=Ceratitis capitata TaxID=7213 RepID=W8C6J1_CERCA|nr:uncharacterized protein LOC105665365 [Ceratitis capitata]CAD7014577.1 unnamed protein product [Ceratitis capitata]
MLSKQKVNAKLLLSTRGGPRRSSSNNQLNAMLLLISMLMALQMSSVSGLLCYTCTYLEKYSDNSCVVDANSTRVTDCTKKYCTIMRQESVHPSGKVISFIRDCLDKPLYLNAVKTDSTFKTFYRSCTTDLCNDSDGTTSATNYDPNFGASENKIIKGKRH